MARMESTKSGTVFRKAITTSRSQPIIFLRKSSVEVWFKFSQICINQDGHKHVKSRKDLTDNVLRIRGKSYLCTFGALVL